MIREIFNFLNFGKKKNKKKKRNREVSKIFNFGNLKKYFRKFPTVDLNSLLMKLVDKY